MGFQNFNAKLEMGDSYLCRSAQKGQTQPPPIKSGRRRPGDHRKLKGIAPKVPLLRPASAA